MPSSPPSHLFPTSSGYQLKRGDGERFTTILSDLEELKEEKQAEERWLLCKFCRQRITSEDQAIQINDHHCHTYSNPAGLRFRIGCFSTAAGCQHQSYPTEEHTWFKGFSWQVALCANCMTQMGWYYQSAAAVSFYGLILDHLIAGG